VRVVSFNIEFSARVDSAIALLRTDSTLRAADVFLLQEMNEPAVQRVARALDAEYVYYPAIYHFRTRRDFGNAVVSRWPIVDDRKLVLPHTAVFTRTQRIATAATLSVRGALVRVYSAHLGTFAEVGARGRRDQLRAILSDAAEYPIVIIGGDMNSGGVGRIATESGYAWPTEDGPRTTLLGRWDHIFLKGFREPDAGAADTGTILDSRNSSDHRPVWVAAVRRQ
jgi:endonuclease/exonuclease/phosphatase family metal-dependent hydrolase